MQQPLSSYTISLLRELHGEILAWERKFSEEHNRKPAKRDIDEAGMSRNYLKYQRLRRLGVTTRANRGAQASSARRRSFGFVPELGRSSSFPDEDGGALLAQEGNEGSPPSPDRRRIEVDSRVLRSLDNIKPDNAKDSFVTPGANKKSNRQPFPPSAGSQAKLSAVKKIVKVPETGIECNENEVPETESEMEPRLAKPSRAGALEVADPSEGADSDKVKEFWEVASNPLLSSVPKKRKRAVNVGHRQAVNLKRRRYQRKKAPSSQPLAAAPPLRRRWSLGGAGTSTYRRIEVLKRIKMESQDRNARLYSEALSLEELEAAVSSSEEGSDCRGDAASSQLEGDDGAELLAADGADREIDGAPTSSDRKDGVVGMETPADLETLLKTKLKLPSFREGQKDAVQKILSGQSVLAVMPTGSGKSLCYQLAALASPGIALVISPLISLMQDQLCQLPASLPGAIWSSAETAKALLALRRALAAGEIKVLFASPERAVSPHFRKALLALPPPGVAFVCVDEAHCVSEWSHNFRPAYLTLRSAVRESFPSAPVLALTATATLKTAASVCEQMAIPAANVLRVHYRRRNLNITVAAAAAGCRLEQLAALMASPRFRRLGSAIVYVATRGQAEEAAGFLRARGLDAGSYHAGLAAQARRRVQAAFVAGRLRVVAATVAFGMGLNKGDVRAVVHLAPPRSLESYAQEVGRAGRDGKPAECHCFFAEADFTRARSLAFAHRSSVAQVRGLVAAAFAGCAVSGAGVGEKKAVYVAICLDELEEKTELSAEVAATVLARLQEADAEVTVHPGVHSRLVVGFLAEPCEIRGDDGEVASLFVKLGRRRNGTFSVELATLLEATGLELDALLAVVLRLKAKHKVWLRWEKMAHFVRNTTRFPSKREAERKIDVLTYKLFAELTGFEDRQLLRADVVADTLLLASTRDGAAQAAFVNEVMEQYFACSDYTAFAASLAARLETEMGSKRHPAVPINSDLAAAISDVAERCASLTTNSLALTRIFHGIPSRAYPRAAWRDSRHWGRFSGELFPRLLERVEVIIANRT